MILGFGISAVAELSLESVNTAHARDLADIHRAGFARGWTDGEFLELLNRPTTGGFALFSPAKKGGKPVGFVLTRAAVDELEILTIGVLPNWRALGCGRKLMDAVLAKAHADRMQSVFLEVDETNVAALALYRRLGFTQVAARKDYYPAANGGKSAALVMRRDVL